MRNPSIAFRTRKRYGETERTVDETHMLDLTGRIALRLVEHFGLISGFPDGEDKAGRAKIGLLPPPQVVERACDIAALFVAETQKRGWIHEVPAPPADPTASE